MSVINVEKYIKPGTSECLKNWIIFTNHHHNDHRTHQETVESFRGTVLGGYLDFDKLDSSEPAPKLLLKNMVCIKDYEVPSFPHNSLIKEGETLEVLGYLMGRDIVLQADPELHPPHYKHLTHVSFVIFDTDKLTEHFKEI